jgi:hypothetical protein
MASESGRISSLFPVSQCPQLIHDFLQSLKPPLLLGCGHCMFVITFDVPAISIGDVGYLVSQLLDTLLDEGLHCKRLPEPRSVGQREMGEIEGWKEGGLALMAPAKPGSHARRCAVPAKQACRGGSLSVLFLGSPQYQWPDL